MVLPPDYVPGFVCHLGTCNITEWGFVHYQPSIPGNVIFLVIIDALGLAQLIMWGYYSVGLVGISMVTGMLSESLGYVARILLHFDPFNRAYFLWYLICLTIGPVFIAAAIYLCLGRIVVVYGEEISRIKPRSYTLFFMGCDVISLVVQAVGGGIAASAPITNQPMIDAGTHVLVAGLSFQVASLFAFSVCSLEYLWRVKKHKDMRNPKFADLYNTKKFRRFLISLFIATGCLFVRTVFRAVELSGGFKGKLANNEVEFMILDGVMVIIACFCLTILHPGRGFQKRWNDAKFPFVYNKKAENSQDTSQAVVSGSPPEEEKNEPNVSTIVS
ncbi:RTA1 like protein [Xylogone sp. PMI_703]|nr:RTA1 like protein [Xylogone sp. PMI_703]